MAFTPELMAAADPMLPRPFRVRRRRKETHDVYTWELEPADGAEGFPFAPGQFTMLYAFGMGEVPISISGDAARPERLVQTIRAVGTVTQAMQRLRPGAMVGVRGPFGTGWPLAAARGQDVVVVAGGLGLAPLRPALCHLLQERAHYGKLTLLYGTRSPADILFPRELERWRGRLDMDVEVTIDRHAPSWRGNVGMVTTLIPQADFDPVRTTALICGPEVMMRFTAAELLQRCISPQAIYVSMERNMKCAVGFCGHCQFGPAFICKDGPVLRYDRVQDLLTRREL